MKPDGLFADCREVRDLFLCSGMVNNGIKTRISTNISAAGNDTGRWNIHCCQTLVDGVFLSKATERKVLK